MSEESRIEAERQRRALDVLKQKSEQHGAQVCTTDGKPPDPDYAELCNAPKPVKDNGQHESYYVLCAEERAKGFVRPVRESYLHTGMKPKHPLRDLTDEEKQRYAAYSYVVFEGYPENGASVTGRFWTQAQLRSGCGSKTVMGRALAETYARDPNFYGATFCCGCGKHFPVEEFVWEDGSKLGS
jgi:hypothetical protein